MTPEQEPKYGVNADGRLYNRETGSVIPDDEPVFILRARDVHAVTALQHYLEACTVDGHKSVVRKRIGHFVDFAINHPDRMREPGIFREAIEDSLPTDKRLIAKDYHVTMADGSVWSIPVDVIAKNRAEFFVLTGYFETIEESLEDTIQLFESDDYSIEDWAENNMNWSDVSGIAKMVSPASNIKFQEGWMNGDKEVVNAE